ncbi:3',5'-cyclic-nucleotide phosphodiesterase pde1 [Tulasnella sp. 419]|nr:3',5'-cyclic-nucleotide phosphodiesterase pde1 [Tulasnella sp. 419]
MHDFDVVVVGCGGGPSETDLSAYFVKTRASKWKDGILALEAGSGLGALTAILTKDPTLFDELEGESVSAGKAVEVYPDPQDDFENIDSLGAVKHTNGAPEHYSTHPKARQRVRPAETPAQTGDRVYSYIRSWIVTHAHLDHVASLILGAGSQGGPTRYIVGLDQTVHDLEGVFNGKVWPKLAAREGERAPDFFYRFKPVSPKSDYISVAPNISASVMPISHGQCAQSRDGTYDSSAWFIRNDRTHREFLFFGDVEPDSISIKPKTRSVWKAAASKIVNNVLDTVFLECSWRSDRPTEELYGHLSPPFVLEELRNLAREIVEYRRRPRTRSIYSYFLEAIGLGSKPPPVCDWELRGVLQGVKLVVTHCKSSTECFPDGRHISEVISDEIREIVDEAELGVSVITARQGAKLEI